MRLFIVSSSHTDFIRLANKVVDGKDDIRSVREIDRDKTDTLRGIVYGHILVSKNVILPTDLKALVGHRPDILVTQELDI